MLDLPLQARAGLHVGRVVLRDNRAADVARGAKPIEVEGVAKATAARIMSVGPWRADAAVAEPGRRSGCAGCGFIRTGTGA